LIQDGEGLKCTNLEIRHSKCLILDSWLCYR